MVQALYCIGLNVVLGVVYNHLHASGPHDKESILDKVDGFRFDPMGHIIKAIMVKANAAIGSLKKETHGLEYVLRRRRCSTDQVNNPNEQDTTLGLGTGPSTAPATTTYLPFLNPLRTWSYLKTMSTLFCFVNFLLFLDSCLNAFMFILD